MSSFRYFTLYWIEMILKKPNQRYLYGLISELTISSTGTSVKEDKDKSRQFSSNLSFSEFIFDGIISINFAFILVLLDEFQKEIFKLWCDDFLLICGCWRFELIDFFAPSRESPRHTSRSILRVDFWKSSKFLNLN